ncbi:MAG: Gmad2 immunoglobulin-like domain-containing protein [Actinomycetota bacterium]|nr:Gmad2 immunoglobulin-like domain-containing protein [Actinomycetota bacterium]
MKVFGALIWVALLVLVLTTGCGQDNQEERGTETTGNSSTTSESQARQETTSEEKRAGEGTTGAPFTAVPEMSGGAEGVADDILGVRFERSEGYERAIIDFGSGGAPASRVPAWSLSSPTGEGYARITFPDVEATSVSDGSLGGFILDNFYVVRAPGGGMFVDLLATGAFQYRVTELSDPGRLLIDYRPADVELEFPLPAQAERTVLFEPRVGEAATNPLRISGYSRNFEASNTVMLRDWSGDVLLQTTVLSNDWLDAWGYFEASLEIPAFEGQAVLQVGTESPRDGSFEGAEVPITYGGGRG